MLKSRCLGFKNGVYDLSNEAADPGSSGLEALESVYSALGISADEIGSLS